MVRMVKFAFFISRYDEYSLNSLLVSFAISLSSGYLLQTEYLHYRILGNAPPSTSAIKTVIGICIVVCLQCIIQWIERDHSCPICRHLIEMPDARAF